MTVGQRGFLLVERLLVIALTGVFLTMTVSAWQGWREAARARQWSQLMQLGLSDLRRQAMREARDLTLCASRDGLHCDAGASAAWLVFADDNGDGLRQPSETGRTLPLAVPPRWRVIWRSFRNQPQMVWLASGDAAFSNGTLTLCPPAAHDAALRQLVISKSGRVRLVLPARAGATTLAAARAACGWP